MEGNAHKKKEQNGTYNLLYNASVFIQNKVCSALTLDGIISTNKENDLRFIPLEPASAWVTKYKSAEACQAADVHYIKIL